MLATIKKDDKGDIVKVAQYLTGYAAIKKASGQFDDAFEAFINDWQSKNGFVPNGEINEEIWKAILAKLPTCSTSKNSKSAYVCAIQILIGGLTVDGIYGSNTKKGVAAYQSAMNLSVDGICGPKTWNALITGDAPKKETSSGTGSGAGQTVSGGKVINNCVHYLQWDSKWKNVKYSTHTSSQTIGNSGCGPSSMAMIMATFIDKNITPVEMCELAVKSGNRTYDNGTKWDFYEYVYDHYDGFSKFVQTSSVETLKAGLKDGALAVCSMNSNDNHFWTSGGHFIVAIGYDSDGYIYANDPNSKTVPRKQKQDKFKSCLKQAFLFWPEIKTPEPVNKDEAKTTAETTTKSGATGSKIIDISKWQGSIDFDKMAKDVALVIARASCGSDEDVNFKTYAKAMNERNIPFGVYCYSYAGDEAKAKDEAQKIVKYASSYKPLFYVMDAEEAKITSKAIKAFATELHAQGATKIGCYVAHNRYTSYGYDSLRSLFDFTWIPRYGSNNGTISGSTKPSYKCDLWQYTSTGSVSGISGNVDMNTITGDGHDLTWFLERETSASSGSSEPVEEAKAETSASSGKIVKIVDGDCYVRTASNTSGGVLGVAYRGSEYPYAGITSSNGWNFINYNGRNGWVSGKYSKLI